MLIAGAIVFETGQVLVGSAFLLVAVMGFANYYFVHSITLSSSGVRQRDAFGLISRYIPANEIRKVTLEYHSRFPDTCVRITSERVSIHFGTHWYGGRWLPRAIDLLEAAGASVDNVREELNMHV
jgi:hypothetical protein